MNVAERIADLLKAHGIKKTMMRTEILDLFMRHDYALSAADIRTKMTMDIDRVTIYRTLLLLEENGILHKASEDSQGAKYALFSQSDTGNHRDRHAHFVCGVCHKTFCLKDVIIPAAEVSQDFLVDSIDYTLHGTCKECHPPSEGN